MIQSPDEVVLAITLGLCLVAFALSGASKVGNPARTLAAMTVLHVPTSLRTRLVATLLPLGELILAACLILAPGPWLGIIGLIVAAIVLLFTAMLLRIILRGENASCGCFGTLSSNDRVTWWTIARNVILLACAGFVAVFGFTSGSFISTLIQLQSEDFLLVLLIWLAIVVAVLIREIAVLRTAALPSDPDFTYPSLESGSSIPDAEIVSATGVSMPLRRLASASPVVLILLSAECHSCIAIEERLDEWQTELSPVQLRVLTSSAPANLRNRIPTASTLAYYGSQHVRQALGVTRPLAAVLLGPGNPAILGSPVVYGEDGIDALIGSIMNARHELPVSK